MLVGEDVCPLEHRVHRDGPVWFGRWNPGRSQRKEGLIKETCRFSLTSSAAGLITASKSDSKLRSMVVEKR